MTVDLLLGAVTQRAASVNPALGLALIATIATSATAAFVLSARQPGSAAARVIVHRNQSGHVTAISGAPVHVVLNPKTDRIISIHRQRHN